MLIASLVLGALPLLAVGQRTPSLGLSNGYLTLNIGSTAGVQLVKDSQVLASLKPSSSAAFDFAPYDKLSQRQYNGNYHTGDVALRVRQVGASAWISGDSAAARKTVTALSVSGNVLASADLTPTLPTSITSLLTVTRSWVRSSTGVLGLRFTLRNKASTAIEVGSLEFPITFNSIFTDRTAPDTNTKCSLIDPYIGLDAGFVRVTPLSGTGPVLLVTPSGTSKSGLEAWRFLTEPSDSINNAPYYQSQTFEGFYSWQVHSKAYADAEWKNVPGGPWNTASSVTIEPGATKEYALDLLVADSVRTIDDRLSQAGRPVAYGIPGYIIPSDTPAKLFLKHTSVVQSLSVSPSGALTWAANSEGNGWTGYTITPKSWGRSRLTIQYADGLVQTVHYHVTHGAIQTVSELGNFLTTKQWYENSSDPFGRSPSIITYDREVNAPVLQDARVWIAGLSDEGGVGGWLAAAMKNAFLPVASEVAKLERFASETVWGDLQYSSGSNIYGVKKSVFFYEPAKLPSYQYSSSVFWGNWWSWNKANSDAFDRAYDYVHVTALYWSLYRAARNYPSLATKKTWQYYISQALNTVLFATNGRVGYADVGLMGETVFLYLLDDLKREGLTANATALESRMKARADRWSTEPYPFGSEMAWDSTGQEGVYAWARYFNYGTTATNTINSILGFMPTVPHWGWNGNARRYWDMIYGAKLQRIERQIHHYGSGLNALPLVAEFMSHPTDLYLLQVGFAGLSGPLSNIDQEGFASAAFHSFPDTLKWDAYSGDYGPNFLGHAFNTGTFLVNHPNFGWQAFGGTVTSATSTSVVVSPRDTLRRRIYIAPLGALFTLDAGAFDSVQYTISDKSVTLSIVPSAGGSSASAANGRLLVSQPAAVSGVGSLTPSGTYSRDAGAYVIPFTNGRASVTVRSN
ncbi:putative glycoside hydrolase family 43 protein [Rhizoctonia solani 123E]|uniref:Putative glycoside hydrolase family 43 protein n=1 Tax=Rhizoctonia solani 123E TaxID=1423351 RepID=A0A074RMJ0_9AGAM|nr:putative glycoside hydrolase family 43 protein [Rhizoctonia solani 123E]